MTREDAIALKQHPSWVALEGEIDRIIDGERLKLETANPKDIDIIIIQERIRALKRMKTLPEDVAERES